MRDAGTQTVKGLSRLCVVAAVLAAALAGPRQANAASFEPTSCRFAPAQATAAPDAAHGRCGWLTVPESRTDPSGPQIRIAVVVYPGVGPSRHDDPVFFLGGGPGWPSIGFDGLGALFFRRTGRDVVVLDQRGLHRSQPALDCPGLSALQFVDPDVTLAGSVEESVLNVDDPPHLKAATLAARTCRDRLERAGVNVAAYSSDESAADIEDLRQALGYGDINLFGTSYGTRLALVTARAYPGHIRSLILDGVFPLQFGARQTGDATVAAFDAFFGACARDPACDNAHPRLRADFQATAAALDAHPMKLRIVPQGVHGPAAVEARVTGETAIAVLAYSLSYFDAGKLVDLVSELDAGRPALFARAYGQLFDTSSSFGMHYSVECPEDELFDTPMDYAAVAERLPDWLRGAYLQGQLGDLAMCRAWGVPRAPAAFRDPVRSSAPALLLSGQFDWETPPYWADAAAATLPNSVRVSVPGLGHQVLFKSACARSIAVAFVDAPGGAVDTGCLNR